MPSLFKTRVSFAAQNTSQKLTEGYLDRNRFTDPPELKNKDKGSLFTPGLYPKKTRKGEVRPTTLGLLAYDIDKAPSGVDDLRTHMKDLIDSLNSGHELELIVHTTYSHKSNAPRYRLLLALDRAVSADEYEVVWEGVRSAFEIPSDKSASRPKQLMYSPAINPSAPDDDRYRCVIKKGGAITADDFLSVERIAETEPDDELAEFEQAVNDATHSPLDTPPGIDTHNWIRAILSLVSPIGMEYEEWLDVILAVAHQLNHDPEGVNILIEWSQAGGKNEHHYDTTPKDIAHKYRTEGGRAKPKTIRSILNKKASGRETSTVLGEAYALLMASAAEPAELAELFEFVKKDTFLTSSHDLGRVATAYRKKFKEIVSESPEDSPTQQEVRNLLSGKAPIDAPDVDKSLADYFYDNYVIQKWDDRIRDVRTGDTCTFKVFNMENRTRMPRRRDGVYPQPLEEIQQGHFGFKPLRIVSKFKYEIEGPLLIEEGGRVMVNRYVPGSFPMPDEPFNPDDSLDAEVKDYVERHLDLISNGDPRAAKALRQWLAHIRQHPHVRQQWGVSLLSLYQGIGKTFYKHLCSAVLGKKQIASISAQQANDKFNQWKDAPKLVTFLDEPDNYKNVKDSRVEMGVFKEFMTGEDEQIRRQRAEWEEAELHTRLAVTGNNRYTMGEEINGRRWLTSIIERGSKEHMTRVYGQAPDKFFARYDLLLKEHGDRVAAYFDSIDLDDFSPHEPPKTLQTESYKSNSLPELTKLVLYSTLRTKVQHDVGEMVVLKPAMREVLDGLMMDDDPDMVRLAQCTPGSKDSLIETALYESGYLPLSKDKVARFRSSFEKSQRVYSAHVWVKEKILDTRGSKETDKHFIDRVLADQAETQNVIDMFDQSSDDESKAA